MKSDSESIGASVARIPSGCSILTIEHEGRSTGVLVSWVQQAAFDPLLISVCIKRGRPVGGLIDAAGRFLLNVIGEESSVMLSHFGKGFSLEEDAFEGIALTATDYGPRLSACVSHLACRVTRKVAAGDHDLYIAEVVAGEAAAAAKPYVHIRKSGHSY